MEKGLFEKVARGVYTLVTKDNESIALIQGDGRDLSMIPDCSIDCIITDHPYFDEKSNRVVIVILQNMKPLTIVLMTLKRRLVF